jgi:predicted transcriptional regulator
MTTALCFLATLLALIVAPLVVIAWSLETPADRARRWHRAGLSQRAIADRLGVTRYRVRCYLATQ